MKKGLITLGLDLSLTSTGAVVWNGHAPLLHVAIRPPGPQKACFEERAHHLWKHINVIRKNFTPDLAIIEAPSYGSISPPIGLWQVYGVIKYCLWRTGQPFHDSLSPQALKKFFTGSGRSTKMEMVEVARSWLPNLADNDDDIADALALAKYGYENYEAIIG